MVMITHYIPSVEESDIEAVTAALRERHLSDGSIVAKLESAVAERVGGAHVIAVSSGTAALYLSLAAVGVQRDATVVVPSYTCNSLYAAVAHCGAQSLCADSETESLCVSQRTVEAARQADTAAVIVPHTCGCTADVDGIASLGMPVIEDCAHAFGGSYPDGGPIGTHGAVSILSFYATKLMPAGQGGACITHDAGIAARIRALRDCDEKALDPLAFNFRMSDVCAALALSRVRHLGCDTVDRAAISAAYDTALSPWACHHTFQAHWNTRFRYLVYAEGQADTLAARAREAGIECKRPIFCPLHFSTGECCPRADRLHGGVLSIPMHSALSAEEKRRIPASIAAILRGL